jgi:hypothetical protein
MKPSTTNFRRIVRNATLGLGLAAVVGGASMAPALAADYGHQDRRDTYSHQDRRYAYSHEDRRDVRQPEWRAHERWEPRYAYAAPSYGYGYRYRYAPAPAYVAPPSLNFVFPIR